MENSYNGKMILKRKTMGFLCTREKLKWWRMENCLEWSKRTAGMQMLGFWIWTNMVKSETHW